MIDRRTIGTMTVTPGAARKPCEPGDGGWMRQGGGIAAELLSEDMAQARPAPAPLSAGPRSIRRGRAEPITGAWTGARCALGSVQPVRRLNDAARAGAELATAAAGRLREGVAPRRASASIQVNGGWTTR